MLSLLVGISCLGFGAFAASSASGAKSMAVPASEQLSPTTKKVLETAIKNAATLAAKQAPSPVKGPIDIERSKAIPEYIPADSPKIASSKNGFISGTLLGDDLSVSKTAENRDDNVNLVLDNAYNALLSGQQEAATSLYKRVLVLDKNNSDALFGLATIYQRSGELAQARTIYTKLLSRDPSNQDALNNFLMLIAEESPMGALIELKKLEALNPNFSPLPAQIGMIYAKMGKLRKAILSLHKAIAMDPGNQTYVYNLAVLYDKSGAKELAITHYRELLNAAHQGAVLPISSSNLRERILFLNSEPESE